MKNNWEKWLLEVHDDLMCRHNIEPRRLPDSFSHEAWLAWSSGRDSIDFAEEFARDRRPEF